MANIPVDEAKLKAFFGIDQFLKGRESSDYYFNLVSEPTCNIAGLISGYTGPGSKTVLPAQATAGTLYYQAILRAFYENGDVPEFKTFGGIRLDLSGPATVLNHKFEKPMRFDEGAQYTFEIDLSWQADPGASSLALATIPAPLANSS